MNFTLDKNQINTLLFHLLSYSKSTCLKNIKDKRSDFNY